jgi:glycosidase
LLATDKTTADNNFDTQHLFYQAFSRFAQLYQQYPALRFGQQHTLYSQKTPGLFVIKRQYKQQQLVIAFNTSTEKQTLNDSLNKGDLGLKLKYQSNSSSLKVQNKQQVLTLVPLSFSIFEVQ